MAGAVSLLLQYLSIKRYCRVAADMPFYIFMIRKFFTTNFL